MSSLTSPSLTANRLNDLSITRLSNTVLRWGASASPTTPTNIQIADDVYQFTAPVTVVLASGTTGTARFYVKANGTREIAVTGGISVTASDSTPVVSASSFPTGSVARYTWTASGSTWAGTGTDNRAFLTSAGSGSGSSTPTGSAGGDLGGTYPNPTVATVGGASAANIATSVTDTTNATNTNTAARIVKRDASGNFSAGTITANLTGNVSGSASTFTGNLTGDVTSTGMATTLSNSGVTAGSYGDSSKSARITVDAKGRVTSVSEQSIAGGGGASFGFDTTRTSSTVLTVASGKARIGAKEYDVAGGTLTVSGSGNGTYYLYIDSSGVLTLGHNTATPTITPSGITVNAALPSGFPVESVPLYVFSVTSAQWDVTLTDKRAVLSGGVKITAGTNITLTKTVDEVTISASGGGGSGTGFDPGGLNFYQSGRSTGWTNTPSYNYGTVSDSGSWKTAVGESAAPIGNSNGGTLRHMKVPGENSGNLPNCLNGKYSFTIRGGKTGNSNDHYFGLGGISGTSTTNIADGVFARWSNANTRWELVVRSGGSDSGAVTVMSGVPNDSNDHSFTFSNDGTTNRVACQVDGGTVYTNTAGTISSDFTSGNGMAGIVTTTGAGIWIREWKFFQDRS